jgi:Xaa-Pro aminopeptidase
MAQTDCDALIVTSLINARWLTGFTGSNVTVVVTHDLAVLITDGRYQIQGRSELDAAGSAVDLLVTANGTEAELSSLLVTCERVGLEAANISWERKNQIAEVLPSADLVPLVATIEKLRQIKDEYELQCLELAASIADRALAETYPLLASLDSITESQFARELEAAMTRLGSEEPSFDTIVASGPNSALPHHRPGGRLIEDGDLVVIDFGAKIEGYGSDMTRTVLAGAGTPTRQQSDLYESVAAAQRAGVESVGDGVSELSIDQACRSVLEAADLAEYFIHGTGHGLGLEIHEQPIISKRSTGTLRSGLVVTVEPGAYIEGFGGVRVEDSVVVTQDGCRPITHSPKGLVPIFGAESPIIR